MRQKIFTTRNAMLTILSVVLAVCLVLGIVFSIPIKASAEDGLVEVPAGTSQWDGDLKAAGWGDTNKTPWSVYSEQEDPEKEEGKTAAPQEYIVDATAKTVTINSAAAFAYFAHEVSLPDNNGFYGYTVTLGCDIDLQNHLWIPIGSTLRKDSKGRTLSTFAGEFDGNGNTIYNFSTKEFYNDGVLVAQGDKFAVSYNDLTILFDSDGGEFCYGIFGVTKAVDMNPVVIKNLNVVNVDLTFTPVDGINFIPDDVAAIVAYNQGSFSMDNCTVGSLNGKDTIGSTIDQNAAFGGIVARIYSAYNEDGTPFTDGMNDKATYTHLCGDVSITNCKNYADIKVETETQYPKTGGIVGYLHAQTKFVLENCENYGDIDSWYVGGITSYYQCDSILKFSVSDFIEFKYLIKNCSNYGNLRGVNVSGITSRIDYYYGDVEDEGKYYLEISGCRNYGDITSTATTENMVGGIIGSYTIRGGSPTVLKDCFNYGDIDGGGYGNVGGLIGRIQPDKDGCNATISGGNSGKVSNAFRDSTGNERIGSCVGYLDKNGGTLTTYNTEYFIDAYSGTGLSIGNNNEATDFTQYLDIQDNVLKGLKEEGKTAKADLKAYSIAIPENVEEVDFAAFVGDEKLAKVTFAENGQLSKIGDWAFAGTGITYVSLPESVTKIGTAAFNGCGGLNNVVLSKDATKIEFGEKSFSKDTYVIASSKAQYDLLKDKITDAKLTYEVTIKYNYNDLVIETEQRLFNIAEYSYNVSLKNGLWTPTDDSEVIIGTSNTANLQWFTVPEGGNENAATREAVSKLLADENCGEVIELYALNVKAFIARTDIVYDGTSYELNEWQKLNNDLLHKVSSLLSADMKVSIIGYTDLEGEELEIPATIQNVGVYTLLVTEGNAEYKFDLTVNPATIGANELSDWKLFENDNKIELTDRLLYIYTYTDENGKKCEYPAMQSLTAEQIAEIGLDLTYEQTRMVSASVVRNRETGATIKLNDSDKFVVSVDYTGNTAEDVGKYEASVTLTANPNYAFADSYSSNSLQGITVKVNNDGTVTVTKVWYVIDLENWLVDFSVPDFTYGDGNFNNIADPVAAYGGEMVITLESGDISVHATLGEHPLRYYINSAMPAGTYTLTVLVRGVYAQEHIEHTEENFNDHSNCPIVWHSAVTETFKFTVDKATISAYQATNFNAVNAALKGQTFEHSPDELLYDLGWFNGYTNATNAVYNMEHAGAIIGRENTYWASEDYNAYYGSFQVKYNLRRSSTDEYSATVATNEIDKYTVYYSVSAPNYYSSIENLKGETRLDYYFYVINYGGVDYSTINIQPKVYTGGTLTADVPYNVLYKVAEDGNSGGVNVANYKVTLELTNDYYKWYDQKNNAYLDERTVELTFSITPAATQWVDTPNVIAWKYKGFDKNTNLIVGSTTDIGAAISYQIKTKDGTPITDEFGLVNGLVPDRIVNTLNDLAAGEYYLHYQVGGTPNYSANILNQNAQPVSFTIGRAVNEWKETPNIASWVKGEYNEEENVIAFEDKFGTTVNDANVDIIIYDSTLAESDITEDNYIYWSVGGVVKTNKLAEADIGSYTLSVVVGDSDNYLGFNKTFNFQIFAPEGLAWWAWLIIIVVILLTIGIIFFILHQKGVLHMLTDKVFVAMRARMTVDATIAAVRANKIAEEAKKSIAAAEAAERAEQERKDSEAVNKPADEQAEKLRVQAEKMQKRADKIKETANYSTLAMEVAAEIENEAPAVEQKPEQQPEEVKQEAEVKQDEEVKQASEPESQETSEKDENSENETPTDGTPTEE